jgi:putative ABC transport system permease protein
MISLIRASLRYYRGVHAVVVAGVAVAVAVLAGALLVGASVRASLRDLALARLGNTHAVATAQTYFTEALATRVEAVPIIGTTGTLVHETSGRVAARVQVFGVDDSFLRFHGVSGGAPRAREAWISEALAAELGASDGDALVLRVAKPSEIPLSTVQGRRDEAGERIRLSVSRIADRASLGEFSLTPAQGPALTMLVPLERLQRDLGVEARVNAFLVGPAGSMRADLQQQVRDSASTDDYGLRIRTTGDERTLVVESRAGIMSAPLAVALSGAASDAGSRAEPVLVHLANTISIGQRSIPYSLVAGRRRSDGIALNEWAATDVGARIGDRIAIDYFVWSDEDGLQTRGAEFTLTEIVSMTGDGADPTFTPEYPGLTDATDVSAWDPPFPVDLKRVRPSDEEYWDRWRAAPKAFVPIEEAQRLWGTTHGNVSSVRVAVPDGTNVDAFRTQLTDAIRRRVAPEAAGIHIRDVRSEALAAADGTTDFGEYFFYFSFFLVVAGLLLAALFFALGIEQRAREIGILSAAGFTRRDIARVLVTEAGVLGLAGSVAGVGGAVAYAALVMHGLRTWWHDAVGTTLLTLHVDWLLLGGGAVAALIAAMAALALALRAALERTPRALLTGAPAMTARASSASRRAPLLALAAIVVAMALIVATSAGALSDVAAFFGAGGALMVAGLLAFNWWLRRTGGAFASAKASADKEAPPLHDVSSPRAPVVRFGAGYARWRPTRSVLSASLIAFACFVIVSVGAFRRGTSGVSLDRALGTGGFALMAEAVAPLMHNPNTPAGRQELGLARDPAFDGLRVSRFRLRAGDEASCLTLYQPRNPRVIAPEDAFLDENRFTFAASLAQTPEERANPWLLLRRTFDDGATPAIADHTSLTYVFHLKVGDDYVMATDQGRQARFRIVGALADSVLQSELIVGEHAFQTLFPRREGYGLWLIETAAENTAALATALEDRLSDYGVDVTDTRARWASYHRVENTYLSTFQALGALGLLVGTLGLSAVLARNVLERRRELALLRAIGFTAAHLRTVVLSESMLLAGAGVILGSATAIVAVVPALLQRTTAVPVAQVAGLLLLVTITAMISSILAARLASSATVVAALKNE